MFYWEKVKKEQNVVFCSIKNSIENNKLAHAFIFAGKDQSSLEDVWKFLVESIISKDPFSQSVRTIESYADLTIIDGSTDSIKKEEVITAMNRLSETPLETGASKILVIKSIENASKQSLNSLLKFIEEPVKDTYIIMTSKNLNGVLSTIKSRSQIFNISGKSLNAFSTQLEESKYPYPNIYANVLSANINLPESKEAKDLVEKTLEMFKKGLKEKYLFTSDLYGLINKKNYKWSTILLLTFFNDIWRIKYGRKTSYDDNELLNSYKDFDYSKGIESINSFLSMMSRNVNFDVALPKLVIELEGLYE